MEENTLFKTYVTATDTLVKNFNLYSVLFGLGAAKNNKTIALHQLTLYSIDFGIFTVLYMYDMQCVNVFSLCDVPRQRVWVQTLVHLLESWNQRKRKHSSIQVLMLAWFREMVLLLMVMWC